MASIPWRNYSHEPEQTHRAADQGKHMKSKRGKSRTHQNQGLSFWNRHSQGHLRLRDVKLNVISGDHLDLAAEHMGAKRGPEDTWGKGRQSCHTPARTGEPPNPPCSP